MNRLTFGVKYLPFLATSVLQQAAIDMADNYLEASEVVKDSFYVDDLLTGTEDIPSAHKLWKNITELCARAGFKLRKFRTNSPEVRKFIPEKLQEKEATLDIPADPTTNGKCLGIPWNTSQDVFYVSTPSITAGQIPTKRLVASAAAKLFDVMGWFAPVVLAIHIYLQYLWSLKLSWDEAVPEEHRSVWEQWSGD